MRRSFFLRAAGRAALLVIVLAACGGAVADAKSTTKRAPVAPPPAPGPTSGASVLTATTTAPPYMPTFTGNGLLGVRVPPAGQGYAPGSVPSQSALAGFDAQPAGGVQQRANLPSWSTLTFLDNGTPFSLSAGTTTNWRQTLDLKTGIVATTATWTAPDGHVTNLAYQLFTDRARPNVGVVQLTLTPQWSGPATVIDTIDGTPATLSTQTTKGWASGVTRDFLGVQAQGTSVTAGLSSQLTLGPNIAPTISQADQDTDQSISQQVDFPVVAGTAYTITKYVGVASSLQTPDPVGTAQAQASLAAAAGITALQTENKAAWAALWAGRIDIAGNRGLATAVNASEFYLWASAAPGVNLGVPPTGLSSSAHNGHVLSDAETWIFPALLAQHPTLATTIDQYRFDRLTAARQRAAATGFKGARYPRESALDGTEQTPPLPGSNAALSDQHVTADVALAQWQYYLATGDKRSLVQRGWPVISQAAAFWASRATLGSDGRYHIAGVTGPDQDNANVNDEAYTNAAAKITIQDAIAAARVLALGVPASWRPIAAGIVVPTDPVRAIHSEFGGYAGQLVGQADVTLLQYPWALPMSKRLAQNDLNFYAPRTDPNGAPTSDAVNSIDAAALGTPGCSSWVYTRRSYEPFIRDLFDQFSETRTGGVPTSISGIGGFLQEFLYGYPGLRWEANDVRIDPNLTTQLSGIALRGLSWRGRQFTVAIGQRATTVTVTAGRNLVLVTPLGRRVVNRRRALVVPTRRPDSGLTTDAVRCGRASASSSLPGEPALAAVDGSAATGWAPASTPATLTVRVAGGGQQVRAATIRWGQQWPSATGPNTPPPSGPNTPPATGPTTPPPSGPNMPPATGPNTPPPTGPVTTLRASSYTLQVSQNGVSWQTVGAVTGRTAGVTDVIHFVPSTARFIRIQVSAGTGALPPVLDELTVTA